MRLRLGDSNVWFASDYHFHHANVIRFDGRPYVDVEDMNEDLISNWNSVIGPKDTVIYMGDFSFDKTGVRTKEVAKDLNGKIHFVLGNHDDDREIKKIGRFETVSDYINLTVPDIDAHGGKQSIMIFHYPILEWDKAHHGSFHLHGHTHQSLVPKNPDYYKYKVLDMGCNGWDYRPVHYNEIKEIMKTKQVLSHH